VAEDIVLENCSFFNSFGLDLPAFFTPSLKSLGVFRISGLFRSDFVFEGFVLGVSTGFGAAVGVLATVAVLALLIFFLFSFFGVSCWMTAE